jgi:hypothetical protein
MSFIEQRIYTLKPEFGPADYFALYDKGARQLQMDTLQGLLGYFFSEVGELNTVISLWQYPDFEARLQRRAALAKEPQWQAFLKEVRPMLARMENRLLLPAPFSPIR